MASPQFGVQVLGVHYGNADSGYAHQGPPSIEHRVTSGGFNVMRPPSMTGNAPRMPLLEKVTPRTINATALQRSAFGQARAKAARAQRKASNVVVGYARALKTRRVTETHFFQKIGSALWSK